MIYIYCKACLGVDLHSHMGLVVLANGLISHGLVLQSPSQVNEKNVRDELATELSNMQNEINGLELEKSKFQHHYAVSLLMIKVPSQLVSS